MRLVSARDALEQKALTAWQWLYATQPEVALLVLGDVHRYCFADTVTFYRLPVEEVGDFHYKCAYINAHTKEATWQHPNCVC